MVSHQAWASLRFLYESAQKLVFQWKTLEDQIANCREKWRAVLIIQFGKFDPRCNRRKYLVKLVSKQIINKSVLKRALYQTQHNSVQEIKEP